MVGALFIASAIAAWSLRRYTRDSPDHDSFPHLLAANALPLTVALAVVSGAFWLAEQLVDPNSAADLSAARWAEEQLTWLQTKAAAFRLPWFTSFIVLLIVFLASVPAAVAGHGLWLARAAARVAAALRRYSKAVTTVNLLLTIACSFTLFDTALSRAGDRLRARIDWAQNEMKEVAALTRAVADVEIRTAVLARTIDDAPPDVRDAAEQDQRLEDASAGLGSDISKAIGAGISIDRIPGVTRGEPPRVFAFDPATPPWTLETNPPISANLRGRTFVDLLRIDGILRAYISTDRFAQKLQIVADMKSRKALTASAVKHVVRATFAPLMDALAVPSLGRLVVDVAVGATADLANTKAEGLMTDAIEDSVDRLSAITMRPLVEKAAARIVADESTVIKARWTTTLSGDAAADLHATQSRAVEQQRSIEEKRAAVRRTLAENHVALEPSEQRAPPDVAASDAELDRPRIDSADTTHGFDAYGFHVPPPTQLPEGEFTRPVVDMPGRPGRPFAEPIEVKPVEGR